MQGDGYIETYTGNKSRRIFALSILNVNIFHLKVISILTKELSTMGTRYVRTYFVHLLIKREATTKC